MRNTASILSGLLLLGGIAIFNGALAPMIQSSILKHRPDAPERAIRLFEDGTNTGAPFGISDIILYEFPDRICPIDGYGAIGDGKRTDTEAINAAIADCARQGGGTVFVPPGTWLTGSIRLASNIRLDLADGAKIVGSTDFNEYLPVVFSRYEGMDYYNYAPLIYAENCDNVAITGKGSIDGNGRAWWSWQSRSRAAAEKLFHMVNSDTPLKERVFGTENDALRPSLINFVNCTSVEVRDISITDGPMWTIHVLYSDKILIRDVSIETFGPNNDGIVVDSSKNIVIDNAVLDTEDDAIVIKSGIERVGRSSENIVIRNCRVGRGNGGIVFGSEVSGGIRNIFVSDCLFEGTKRGIRIKTLPGRGGVIENIFVKHVAMKGIAQESIIINTSYDSKNVIEPAGKDPTTLRNISFRDITATSARTAILIDGDSRSPIRNISLEQASFRSVFGATVRNVSEGRFDTIDIKTAATPAMIFSDTNDIDLRHISARSGSSKPPIFITGNRTRNIRYGEGASSAMIRRDPAVPPSEIIFKP